MKIKVPSSHPGNSGGMSEMDIMHQHIVKQGDTLWKLSKAWGVPLATMIHANPHLKNPNVLLTGEVINIPKANAQVPATTGQYGTQSTSPKSSFMQGVQGFVGKMSTAPVVGKTLTGLAAGKKNTAPIPNKKPTGPIVSPVPPAKPEAKIEPEAKKVEPLATKKEPEAKKVEPLATKKEPEAKKVEPLATKKEPEAKKVEPLAMKKESEAKKVEPLATKKEPEAKVEPLTSKVMPQSSKMEPLSNMGPSGVNVQPLSNMGPSGVNVQPLSNMGPSGVNVQPLSNMGPSGVNVQPLSNMGPSGGNMQPLSNMGPSGVNVQPLSNMGPSGVNVQPLSNMGPSGVNVQPLSNMGPSGVNVQPLSNTGPSGVNVQPLSNMGPSGVNVQPLSNMGPSGGNMQPLSNVAPYSAENTGKVSPYSGKGKKPPVQQQSENNVNSNSMNGDYMQSMDLFQQYQLPAYDMMQYDYPSSPDENMYMPISKGEMNAAIYGMKEKTTISPSEMGGYVHPLSMGYPMQPTFMPYGAGPGWGYGNPMVNVMHQGGNMAAPDMMPLSNASNAGMVSPLSNASNAGMVSPLSNASNAGMVSPLSNASNAGMVSPLSAMYPPPGFDGASNPYWAVGYPPMWSYSGEADQDQPVQTNTKGDYSERIEEAEEMDGLQESVPQSKKKTRKKKKKAIIRTIAPKPKKRTTYVSRPWINH
ncbi:LysM peptidoglycan-binding domain-containing protein [Paenibacillus chungangensis]